MWIFIWFNLVSSYSIEINIFLSFIKTMVFLIFLVTCTLFLISNG